jgi:hypothetical protein
MTTSNPNQPAQQQPLPNRKYSAIAQSNKKQRWLKLIEFAVVGFATWLNPQAGFLIFLLKLCFQILQALQEDR